MGERENLDATPEGETPRTGDPRGSEDPGPPHSPGPDSEGPDSEGPDSEGPDSEGPDSERRRDKIIGLGIVAVTFVVGILLSLWAKQMATPPQSREPAPPTKLGLEGFPAKVDPVAILPVARGLSDRPLFRGFDANGVSPHGAMDFSDPTTRVRFAFQSGPGQGPQPPREPGTLPSRTYCGRQNVVLTHDGIAAEPDIASSPCPSVLPEALAAPTCNLATLWEMAKRKGANTKRRARIEYFQAQDGPAYRFSIPGTKHRFVVGEDCKRELKGKKATGSVP